MVQRTLRASMLAVALFLCPDCLGGALAQGPTALPTVTVEPAEAGEYLGYLTPETPSARQSPSTVSVLLDLSWKLGLVLALVYVALRGAKRFMTIRVVEKGKRIEVLETVGLGTQRSLYLVRAGGRTLLLGATAQELTTLADLTEATDGLEDEAEMGAGSPGALVAEDQRGPNRSRALDPVLAAVSAGRRLVTWPEGPRESDG